MRHRRAVGVHRPGGGVGWDRGRPGRASSRLPGGLRRAHRWSHPLLRGHGPTSAEDRSVDAGTWTANSPITSFAAWSLNGPHAGWTAALDLAELQADREYTLYGWTHDNSSSTGSVTVSGTRLREMTPGQVLYLSGYDEKADQDLCTTGSVREFQSFACS